MKIIALMPVKNEEWILRTSIPQLQRFADEVLTLNISSTDSTVEILKSMGVEIKDHPYYPINFSLWRQVLLDWGRERGGTHFIWLDADEAFTSNLLPEFRNHISKLKAGQKLALHWLCLWKDARKYRQDASVWSNLYKDFVFCDDGTSGFTEEPSIHEGRTPGVNTPENWVKLSLSEGAVLHFQFVPFENFQMKQAFRKCHEYLEGNEAPFNINRKYAITMDDNTAQCVDIPKEWLEGINGLDGLKNIDVGWYHTAIQELFDDKGISFFEHLQIWHLTQLRDEFVRKVGREPKPALKSSFFKTFRSSLHTGCCKMRDLILRKRRVEA